MTWERFASGRNRGGLKDRVSICKNGFLSIGEARQVQIGLGKFVELYIDREGRRVAIKPIDAEGVNTYRVFGVGRSKARSVGLKAALAELGCTRPAKAIRLPATVQDGMLVVDCSALAKEEAPSDGN